MSGTKLSQLQIDELINLYKENTSKLKLQKQYKIGYIKLKNILYNNNVKTKNQLESCTKYTLDQNFFDTINTEEKAYWLGFIMGDGWISRNSVSIGLCLIDIDHLYKFNKSIQSNRPIKIQPPKLITINNRLTQGNGSCEINIWSKHLVQSLNKLYISNDKCINGRVPCIEEKLERHFWRGMIDSDGWVSTGKGGTLNIGLCGNRQIITSFHSFSIKNNVSATIHPDHNIFRINIKNYRAEKISQILYNDCSIFLNRKMEKYKTYFQNLQPRLKNKYITFLPLRQKWVAKYKSKTIGSFQNEEEALLAQKKFISDNNLKPVHEIGHYVYTPLPII